MCARARMRSLRETWHVPLGPPGDSGPVVFRRWKVTSCPVHTLLYKKEITKVTELVYFTSRQPITDNARALYICSYTEFIHPFVVNV